MAVPSIAYRYSVTVLANVVRMIFNVMATVLLSRGLGVSEFGNLSFLLGNFTAITTLVDIGASQAFFTAISQRPRGVRFAQLFILYQVAQLVVLVIVIGLMLPHSVVQVLWFGRSRGLILVALVATVLQQQMWTTVSQIGEAQRLTHRVQIFNILISLAHCVLLVALWGFGWMSVTNVLILISAEFLIALILLWRWLGPTLAHDVEPIRAMPLLKEYWSYCYPLLGYNSVGFLYAFADSWLLQNFGGNVQQAYYGMAVRMGTFCLLLPTSMVNVLWKEVAEAHWRENSERVRHLVERNWRSMFLVSSIVAGSITAWAAEIIHYGFGDQYAPGVVILGIMLLNAVYTAMNQSNSIIAYATGRTRDQAIYGIIQMGLSLVAVYFLVASPSATVPGLGLGGLGVALKMAAGSFIFVNSYTWWICRQFHWQYRPFHQFATLGVTFFGAIIFHRVLQFPFLPTYARLMAEMIGFAVLYGGLVSGYIYVFPSAAGANREELCQWFVRLKTFAGRVIRA